MKRSFFSLLLLGLLGQSIPLMAQKAAALFAQAQQESDPHKAIDLYAQSLLLDPYNARVYEKRALLKEQLGQTIRATADLDTLINLEPTLPTGYYLRARCRLALERLPQALDDYTQAIELDELVNYPDAHLMRARTYISLEEHQKAVSDLNWYGLRYPAHSETHYLRGLVNTRKGNYAVAIQNFNRVIKLNTDHVSDAYGQRANVHYALGNIQNAVQDAEQALVLNPQNELALQLKLQLSQLQSDGSSSPQEAVKRQGAEKRAGYP